MGTSGEGHYGGLCSYNLTKIVRTYPSWFSASAPSNRVKNRSRKRAVKKHFERARSFSKKWIINRALDYRVGF